MLTKKYFLFYVGFQRTERVPYMLFSGVARYDTASGYFVRMSRTPVVDRGHCGVFSNGAPFVMADDGIYKMWFWVGKDWISLEGKLYLRATIAYAESNDGLQWIVKEDCCIEPDGLEEFSVGRPWVVKEDGRYRMWYCRRLRKKLYRMGYAESRDGLKWVRIDRRVGLDVSDRGWDDQVVCYPAVISTHGQIYMFYNGNGMGRSGFGYAVLDQA